MNAISFTLILCGVLLNASAQLLLKAGVNAAGNLHFNFSEWSQIVLKIITQWPILAGLMCYAISVIFWIAALSRVDVSVAYPMLSLGYVVNAIAAYFFLGESLSVTQVLGMSIILLGVFILARG